jgi:hypothetical protein
VTGIPYLNAVRLAEVLKPKQKYDDGVVILPFSLL